MPTNTSSIVWPWRDKSQGISAPKGKKGPWIQFGVMATVSVLLYFYFEHAIPGLIVGGLSVLLLSGLLFFDRVLLGFEKTGLWLAHVIGVGLTRILLVPFYYIIFGLGHLFLLLRSKDPMRRALERDRDSYWSPHRKLDIEARYHRQF